MTTCDIILGDCLDKLKELDDNSVDSIVTDPPYGLGDNLYKRVNKAVWKSFNVMLPNFMESDIKRLQYKDFSVISGLCSDLSRCETIPIIKSGVAMPKSSVDFYSDIIIREEEINRSAISTSFDISDSVLVNKFDSKGSKFVGNFIFDFGDSVDFTTDNFFRGNFGQFSSGFFSVPISSIFSSCFPNSMGDFPFPIFRDGIFDVVWGSNHVGNHTFSHSFALTVDRAEDVPVLTFDLTRASGEFSATISTQNSDIFTNFIRPKLVRTNLTTSSLSTMLQPIRVSFVLDGANGTVSEYFFHLYIPKNLLKSISSIYDNARGFMGKKWDYDVPSVEVWQECLRVLKPGGHLLAFAGTRTQHRMAVSIEDAGFEIRDMIAWVYGSGFPKSLDISKAIDKGSIKPSDLNKFTTELKKYRKLKKFTCSEISEYVVGSKSGAYSNWENGLRIPTKENWEKLSILLELPDELMIIRDAAEREIIGKGNSGLGKNKPAFDGGYKSDYDVTAPATEEAKQWEGWGTALKPALEPITVARKPISEKTIAENVLKHGTGGINIDGSRVAATGEKTGSNGAVGFSPEKGWNSHNMPSNVNREQSTEQGRFPANLIHDGSEEVVELFPITTSGSVKPYTKQTRQGNAYVLQSEKSTFEQEGDSGSAARFFYCAKTSKKDRNEGLDDFEEKSIGGKGNGIGRVCSKCGAKQRLEAHLCKCEEKDWVNPPSKKNNHPTVKPTDLMRYLVRMVTPRGGVTLDPFMGSGSTGKAAKLEGFNFIGIELDPDYIEIAKARIENAKDKPEKEKKVANKEKKEYNTPINGLDRFFE